MDCYNCSKWKSRTELDLVAINYIDDYCEKAEHVFIENVVPMKYSFLFEQYQVREFPFYHSYFHVFFLPNGYLDIETRISDHVNHFMQLRKLEIT